MSAAVENSKGGGLSERKVRHPFLFRVALYNLVMEKTIRGNIYYPDGALKYLIEAAILKPIKVSRASGISHISNED